MITYHGWHPDVCECYLVVEVDTDKPNHGRVLLAPKVVKNDQGQDVYLESKLCPAHSLFGWKSLYTDEELPQADECRRKNYTFDEAQKIVAGLTLDDYTWSFDPPLDGIRKLKVGFLGKLNASHKANLKTVLDAKFGGKVEVL